MSIWKRLLSALIPATMLLAGPVQAQDVWITPDLPFFEFEAGGEFYLIERDQDNEAVIVDMFAKTSRACPPFCIQPIIVADGVETVGEVELLDFIEDYVEPGNGFLVDSRVENFYFAGTIPGAVNIPFNMFAPSSANPFLDQLLILMGGKVDAAGSWNFDEAAELLLFCNGPWCGQSPRAIKNLLAIGYPADRLHYYRGGMQAWTSLGMSVLVPG
ncbi:MAG: sulfurtransferase [Rhodobacteraceae bacterium]|nr:MAG: sulfurtransferase [Paracoccaceae bacterium]